MSEKDFIQKYLQDFSTLVKPDSTTIEKIIKVKNILVETSKNNKKVIDKYESGADIE